MTTPAAAEALFGTAAFFFVISRFRDAEKRRRRKSRRRRSIGPVAGGAERSRWTFDNGGRAPASAVEERGARPRGGAPGVRRGHRRLRARFRVGGEISVATREPDLAGAHQGHGTRRGPTAPHRAPRIIAKYGCGFIDCRCRNPTCGTPSLRRLRREGPARCRKVDTSFVATREVHGDAMCDAQLAFARPLARHLANRLRRFQNQLERGVPRCELSCRTRCQRCCFCGAGVAGVPMARSRLQGSM